jgi:DNA-binding winged helix-turn-helix (wHTH) protein/TolB-like protein
MHNELNNYKTADLVIQADLGQVMIGSESIRLGPVNMKVLVLLVQNQERVVSRTILFDKIWKNQTVSDDTLTRCISDLRSKLGKYSSFNRLIITIPKKGYQWSPSSDLIEKNKDYKQNIKGINWYLMPYIKLLLVITLGLITLSITTLWLANYLTRPNHVPILLIPLKINNSKNQLMADKIEDSLRTNILQTKNIRFLSNTMVSNKNDFSLSLLSNQYGVQWAIEAKVREINGKFKIILSLVDTRTALEVYSKSRNISGKNVEINQFCLEFINDLDQKLLI